MLNKMYFFRDECLTPHFKCSKGVDKITNVSNIQNVRDVRLRMQKEDRQTDRQTYQRMQTADDNVICTKHVNVLMTSHVLRRACQEVLGSSTEKKE
jgi:hypothetical protein